MKTALGYYTEDGTIHGMTMTHRCDLDDLETCLVAYWSDSWSRVEDLIEQPEENFIEEGSSFSSVTTFISESDYQNFMRSQGCKGIYLFLEDISYGDEPVWHIANDRGLFVPVIEEDILETIH